MTNNTMVGNVSEDSGASVEELVAAHLKERAALIGSVVTKMLNGALTDDEIKRFDNRENPFVRARLSKNKAAVWEKLYRDEFGMSVDLSQVAVPDNPGGFGRTIVIATGLTAAMVVAACRKYFKDRIDIEDLDADVPENERTAASGSYAIRVRDRIEADEELKNLSAEDIKARGVATMTLLERLVYELKYFKETGQHLDIGNWTLCAGSRRRVGDVPIVRWRAVFRRLHVYWCHPQHAYGLLRARAVVS